ncbi:MAG: multicopper oxidase family protein [Gammaproteobacteria bacterium]|nr:multicopper oxidase family protein [Gammaproteobacteria bacterium]
MPIKSSVYLNTVVISSLFIISACSSMTITDEPVAASLTNNLDCTGTGLYQELREPPTLHDVKSISTNLTARSVNKCVNGKVIELQSYIDTQAGTDNRPVGPAYILDVDANQPGPVLRIRLSNQLGDSNKEYDCGHHGADVALCTNLHTHGFHVSPKGSTDPSVVQSDFVFIAISPATQAVQYQFDIPNYHAPGTHWMHAHLHGSTAPQVKNGMAGALILKGELDRKLAADYGISGSKDKIMILTQMSTADDPLPCGQDNGVDITTSINGQCLPTITVKAGDIHRWRFIHAGISASIKLTVEGNDTQIQLHEFARDGVTMNGTQIQPNIMLQPGYRSDVLLQFPPCSQYPCEYYLVDDQSTAAVSLMGEAESHNKIAKVIVQANNNPAMRMPPTTLFTNPYPFVCDPADFQNCSEKLTKEKVWFANTPNASGGTYKTVNDGIYPDTPTKQLKLNDSNTWKLWVGDNQDSDTSHPFHIHVNPFQLIDDNGFSYWKDTLLVSGSDNKGEANAITVLSRYDNFDGEFVLHCHNLTHEDQGMMMKVIINK